MSLSEQWISNFRTVLKSKCGKNWTVYNSRGNVRLQVGKRPNEETLSTFFTIISNSEKGQSKVETTNVFGIKKGANCPLF